MPLTAFRRSSWDSDWVRSAAELLTKAKAYRVTIAPPSSPIEVSWRVMTGWFNTSVVAQLKNRVNRVDLLVWDR